MTGFRRTSRSTHVVHAIRLPSLERSKRPALRRQDPSGRLADPGGPAADGPTTSPERQRGRFAAPRPPVSGDPRSRFRVVRVSPEEALDRARPSDDVRGEDPSAAAVDTARVERLERRLAKLARLLEARDTELRNRSRQVDTSAGGGVASRYAEVQGLQGDSEDVERKRALMKTLFEANRKLRERVGPDRAVAE